MVEHSGQTDSQMPVLVFDGDCGICREWVDYWQLLTEGRFEFRPYQEVAASYPQIPREEFARAIQLIEGDRISSGAAATFNLYRDVPGYAVLPTLYRHVPGFAAVSEFAYGFLSRRRGLLAAVTHLCWGRKLQPTRYTLTSWLFLRLLGLIYLAAFVSLGVQIIGLAGSEGILPVKSFLDAVAQHLGHEAWWRVPSLFWFNASDAALRAACLAGAVAAGMVVVNLYSRAALVICYVLYLSLYFAGQAFMAFQWDALLLEAGVLGILLTSGSAIAVWLYRWLVFRFMFMGGMVKLLSHDPTWRNLTALNYHFETQPLPTAAAWYAHHLPQWALSAGVMGTFFIELVVPFLIFAPRRFRMAAGCCILVLQSLIALTGNYNFFNLLTMSMCVLLFDDAALAWCIPKRLAGWVGARRRIPGRAATAVVAICAGILIYSSTELMVRVIGGDRHGTSTWLTRVVAPCQCVNTYGPFAVMTTQRNEILIQGSMDGRQWRTYEFKYKPGDLARRPGWIIPHQPRLDWQMWFAALTDPRHLPWFHNLLGRLLLNSAPVVSLFQANPFPDEPPVYVRALFYRYQFTTAAERKATGNWWKRRLLGLYYPPVHLVHRS